MEEYSLYNIQINNLSKSIQSRNCSKFIELCNKELPDNIMKRVYLFNELFNKLPIPPEDWFDFKENYLKRSYPNSSFIYEYEFSLFEMGLYSPKEIDDILTTGTKLNMHNAYALKSLFYEIGLYKTQELAINDIKKAILMQPNNTTYKQMLYNIERNISNFYTPH